MKKFIYLIPLFALGLGSCSSDEPVANGNDDYTYDGSNQYLTISINSAGTRAESYENGEAAENKVSKVRFYFFTANGDAANVKAKAVTDGSVSEWQSYYEISTDVSTGLPGNMKEPSGDNVAKIMDAQIIIDTDGNDKVPYSVVAVLNPSDELGTGNLSLSDLSIKLEDYEALANDDNPSFVMSNSIYADANQQLVKEYGVREHIKSNIDDAKANALELFVERAVAKIRMKVAISGADKVKDMGTYKIYNISEKYDVVDMGTGETLSEGADGNIYVKFLGWNVTSTTENAYLLKSINTGWASDLFGWGTAEPWNNPANHRSFWAINPNNVGYNYGNFGVKLPSSSNEEYKADGKYATYRTLSETPNFVYVQENAAKHETNIIDPAGNHSKIIVAAQLVDSNGNAITMAELGAQYYTVNGLKIIVANEVNLWKKVETDGQSSMKKIEPEDIDFMTAVESGKKTEGEAGSYNVYPVLKNRDASTSIWYTSNDITSDPVDFDGADGLVKTTIGPVKIWNEGLTYYYIDITHLGKGPETVEGATTDAAPGYLGVVRNHVYDTDITSIKGLGTPVYNPSEKIYPEHPDKDRSVIAAKINILAWRIVTNHAAIDW